MNCVVFNLYRQKITLAYSDKFCIISSADIWFQSTRSEQNITPDQDASEYKTTEIVISSISIACIGKCRISLVILNSVLKRHHNDRTTQIPIRERPKSTIGVNSS